MEETKHLGEQPIKKLLLKFSVPCVMGLLIGAVVAAALYAVSLVMMLRVVSKYEVRV